MNFPQYISIWANHNKKTARWLIFFLSLFSAILFFETGLFLPDFNPVLSIIIWLFAVATSCFCWFSYYTGMKRLKRTFIYLCLSVLWLHFGNQSLSILTYNSNIHLETASVAPIKPITESEKPIRKFFSKHLKKRQQQLRKHFVYIDSLSPVAAFFIFFLLALLALAIAYFLAIVSCSLSCNGQVAMSYVVLISAAIFAMGGLFLIGYAIYRAVKKPNKSSTNF